MRSTPKTDESAEIAKAVKAFLKKGGKITKVPIGATGVESTVEEAILQGYKRQSVLRGAGRKGRKRPV